MNKEYITKTFAEAVGRAGKTKVAQKTVANWRTTNHGKPPRLLPARYEGRTPIYTEEQIPLALALLGKKNSAADDVQTVVEETVIETDGTEEDNDDSVFDFLPALDELNDVDEYQPIVEIVTITEDANEYAVNPDAQEVALDAEIELAKHNVTIEQESQLPPLEHLQVWKTNALCNKNELQRENKRLIEYMQSSLDLGDEKLFHELRKELHRNNLDIITANKAVRELDKQIAAYHDAPTTPTEPPIDAKAREKFLHVKEKHFIRLAPLYGRKIWYVDSDRVGKAKVAKILAEFDLTPDEYLAEQGKWIAELNAAANAQVAIEEQAASLQDKIQRESKSLDDESSPFALLPFEIEDEQFAGEDTDRNARFNRGERLAEAATSRIRKFDKTADITFDINEDGEDTFLLDSSTICRTPFGTAADAEQAFFDIIGIEETAEISEEGNEFRRFTVNGETVTYFNGELNFIKSDTYHASLAAYRNQYVVEVPDGRWKKFKRLDVDEFFQVMSERGACSIDGKPEPPVAPQSDFTAKLAALKDTYDKAEKVVAEKKIVLDEAEKEYNAAGKTSTAALMNLQTFLIDAKEQLAKELLADIESPYEIAITAHNGRTYKTKFRDAYFVFGDIGEELSLLVYKETSCITWKLATYDTPDQMRAAIALLKAAITHGDKSFTFPPAKIVDACQEINSNAPDGWSVDFDAGKNNYTIKFGSQPVATIDSLALAKVLPPEKFFEQFKPLVDKDFDADKKFISDRQREIEQLIEMREELAGDPERLKIIDKLITQNELAG